MKNRTIVLSATALIWLTGCTSTQQPPVEPGSVNDILSNNVSCSPTITLRFEVLPSDKTADICQLLQRNEQQFHQLFNSKHRPVADDNNQSLRANIYASREQYVNYATKHFNMPTDNGGMYLEGLPYQQGNQAEFVAYVSKGNVWNLGHEYIHYLDGRFNQYGDYCLGLHDDHSGPEFCPDPTPAYPHLVWWGEGVAEYIAKGSDNPKALVAYHKQRLPLSDLFNTSYNHNGGSDRVYRLGYLAVRYMVENQRNRVDQMLELTRVGNYEGYQRLVQSWGRTMDQDFDRWVKKLN